MFKYIYIYFFFFYGSTVLVGFGLLRNDLRLYSFRHSTLGFLWTSDRPVAVTNTSQKIQNPQGKDIHASGGIQTRNPSKERPHTHSLNRAATGIGITSILPLYNLYQDLRTVASYLPEFCYSHLFQF
jgi:hypothetical protein